MSDCKTELDCRLVYSDIVTGKSECQGGFFLKHYSELDISNSEKTRRFFLKDAEDNGLLKEEDKLKLLAENSHWSKEEEDNYIKIREELDSLRFSLKKLVIPAQIEHMKGLIKEKEKEVEEPLSLRNSLLGTTAEYYASKRATEYHILNSFYKDESLKIRLFDQDEMDDLSEIDLNKYMIIYNDAHDKFRDRNFKKVAVCPFFMNAYITSNENVYHLFGKPIINLTIYQSALIQRARFYKTIIYNDDCQSPPEEYYDDLNKVVKFYDQQYSILLGKKNQEKSR